jgi:hypothetical protein
MLTERLWQVVEKGKEEKLSQGVQGFIFRVSCPEIVIIIGL